jgi:hypothetical protein
MGWLLLILSLGAEFVAALLPIIAIGCLIAVTVKYMSR